MLLVYPEYLRDQEDHGAADVSVDDKTASSDKAPSKKVEDSKDSKEVSAAAPDSPDNSSDSSSVPKSPAPIPPTSIPHP